MMNKATKDRSYQNAINSWATSAQISHKTTGKSLGADALKKYQCKILPYVGIPPTKKVM